MNIVLGSAFRNASAQIDRWSSQCCSLETALDNIGYTLGMVAVEGDSTDSTKGRLEALCNAGAPLSVVTCDHGQRVFGSTECPDRLAALSKVGNAILSSVNETDDILVYVESDLVWKPETIMNLIHRVVDLDYDVIAPLIFADENFYDVFVYRGLDGERFGPFKPYHSSLAGKELPVEVSSVGSCLVMKAEVARKCQIRNDMALLGFCADVREKGYRIFVDPMERIEHP